MLDIEPWTQEQRPVHLLSAIESNRISATMALEWAELIRRTSGGEADLLTLGILRDGQPVGIAILLELKQFRGYRYLWRPVSRMIDRSPLLRLCFPDLNIGFLEVPIANYSGLFTTDGLDAAERDLILRKIAEFTRQRLKWHFLCIKENSPYPPPGPEDPFDRLNFLPNAILSIQHRRFEDFLAALPSKKRRKLLADRQAMARHGATLNLCRDPSGVSEELFELYQSTNRRKQRQRNYIPMPFAIDRDFFDSLSAFEALDSKALLIRVEGRLIAYCLLLQGGGTLYFRSVGLDYHWSLKTRAYFNLIYATIELAIQQGCERVDFGLTSYTFKKRMGCVLYPSRYRVAFHHPLLRALSRAFIFLLGRQFRSLEY